MTRAEIKKRLAGLHEEQEIDRVVDGLLDEQERCSAEQVGKDISQLKDSVQAAETALANKITGPYTESEVKTDVGEEVHLRDSGQRTGSEDSGGQVPGMEESTGRAESWNTEGGSADREAAALTHGEEKVSARSLGITGGTADANIHVVTGGDTEHTRTAKQLAQERGLELVLFTGGNLDIKKGGVVASARAYIQDNKVYIRADHPLYTSDQLMRHETGHDMIAKGEIDPNTVRQRIVDMHGAEKLDELSRSYAEAYAGSRMTPEEIWEEIICDNLGDMNIFAEVKETVDEVGQTEAMGKAVSADVETVQSRGPPEGKMSQEWQSYELSDEFLTRVNYGDRHAFLRLLANQTSDIQHGHKKRLVFYINSNVYFFEADGYMNGHIEEKIAIGRNKTVVEKVKEEFLNGVDESTETPDSMAEGYRMYRGGNDWDSFDGRYPGEEGGIDGVYVGESDSNTPEYFGEDVGDFEEVIPGSMVYDGMGDAYTVDEDGMHHTIKLSQKPARPATAPSNAPEIQDNIRAAVREELNRMGKEYGWIKAGENPARDIQMPKRTSENKKLSQTVRTVMEAGAIPEDILTAEEAFFYDENTQLEGPEVDSEAFLYGMDSAYDRIASEYRKKESDAADKILMQKEIEKYAAIHYREDGTVVVTDDWTDKEHPKIPKKYRPNAVVDTLSLEGKQKDRTIYDGNDLSC